MDDSPLIFTARYDPRRLRPGLAVSALLLAVGVASALTGVSMGWILAAFMLWTLATLTRRALRRSPVLSVGPDGVHDHRTDARLPWSAVDSMRTVDRRIGLWKVPLLELVPAGPREVPGGRAAAVLRGDLALADARDDRRLMIDLRHLDATPEQVLAAARGHRG